MFKIRLIATSLAYSLLAASATSAESDFSTDTLHLDEVAVTAIKQGTLNAQPSAYTVVGRDQAQRLNITSIRDISEVAPNLYMPQYGSRMTAQVYLRGMGARLDQPVMGLAVDNVSFLNKDSYDFDLLDIERIELLRGPQNALYGRNTMGGQMNIYTISPFRYQGGRVVAEGGNGPHMRLNISYYHKFSPRLAMSWGGSLLYNGGLYTNHFNGEKVGLEKNATFRWKTQAKLKPGLQIENILSFNITRQGGYPYADRQSGKINYNDTCYYRRNAFSNGFTLNWQGENISISSITGVQYVDDIMRLDQDFQPIDIFVMRQGRKEWAVTQDLVFSGNGSSRYKWLAGAFGFFRRSELDVPVTMKGQGIKQLILDKVNSEDDPVLPPGMALEWRTPEIPLHDKMLYPVAGGALYHKSSFGATDALTFEGSIRFDYEKSWLHYHSWTNTACEMMKTLPNGNEIPLGRKEININNRGELGDGYYRTLPKISALYRFDRLPNSNIYISAAKGYKSGGFNTQMFSDILSQELKIKAGMPVSERYSPAQILRYKPEYSWNYEIGTHLELPDGTFTADASVFYIDCRDQQITTFPDASASGRLTTNAGRTRSAGVELQIAYNPTRRWSVNASYGFTDAKLIRYNNAGVNYKGKYVPYVPQNTLFASLLHRLPLKGWVDGIDFELNARGVGRIYWDETNNFSQPFYVIPSAQITARHRQLSLQLWCRNFTATKYNVFAFNSLGRDYVQKGAPLTWGITLRVNFQTGQPF